MKKMLFMMGMAVLAGLNARAAAPRLKVSANHRFLVYADGRPFFWQADTGWEMSMRLNRADMEHYLTRRHEQGFTVVYVVAFGITDGPAKPNANGHLAFVNLDPTKPAVKEGPDNDFWDDLDAIVEKAESMGMFIGLLPSWGDAWHQGGGPWVVRKGLTLFNPENARVYSEWLGKRYKDHAVIWIIGGDRPVDNETNKAVIRAIAQGLRIGDEGAHLITFHSARGSSEWFHNEPWLDFNMWQTGHNLNYRSNYDKVPLDYERKPIKPVVDGESIYEGPPISFNAEQNGHSIAADVRRPVYWELFQGAFGFTYGNHSTWQMYTSNREPVNLPLRFWQEALEDPGANQMQYAKKLMLSRPFLTRIPDNSIIVDDRVPTAVPGGGRFRFVATRDEAGTYAMVYVPDGQKFQVRMDTIKGAKVKAWWYDPRTGKATKIGTYSNQGVHEFSPPTLGELLDYVLVLDDAARDYPVPGSAVLRDGKG